VFLLGPPGSGKSSLGGPACAGLGLRFLDLPDDAAADAGRIAASASDAEVVTLPWNLQSDPAILRTARRLGTTIALWAHPETMQARARQPITFTPGRKLVTRGGFGRHGTSCLEFRRLERACDFTLDLDGLSENEAVGVLAEAIADTRAESDPAARLDARRKDIEEQIRGDVGRRHRRAVAGDFTRVLMMVEEAQMVLERVPIRSVDDVAPGDPAYSLFSLECVGTNPAFAGIKFVVDGMLVPLPPSSWYIGVCPSWETEPQYKVTRLIHESFHMLTTPTAHDDSLGEIHNVYRLQGFVSQLTNVEFNRSFLEMQIGEPISCA
jgi:hypothetical protein